MPGTATPVVTKLNFAEFAARIRSACGYLDEGEKKIQKQIIKEAPSWVAAHVTDDKNCEVILLEGTNGHPNWTPAVRDAINKNLPYHRNTAGQKVTLTTG